MKITLIEPRGFCFGVNRALEMLDHIDTRPAYILHEIVHNQQVIDSYKQKGFIFVETLDDVPNESTVVFSGHGVAKHVVELAKAKNLKIIDTTCPFVERVHKWVQSIENEGRTIILIGKKNHAEIMGTYGQLTHPEKAYLISSSEDIKNLPETLGKIGIATQTTLSAQETNKIISLLQQKYPDCAVQSGICQATTQRQQAVKKACQTCDTILVIGDKKSSNCMQLIELARNQGAQAYLIERAQDVLNIAELGENIGITAAASAPEQIVQDVVSLLQSNRH